MKKHINYGSIVASPKYSSHLAARMGAEPSGPSCIGPCSSCTSDVHGSTLCRICCSKALWWACQKLSQGTLAQEIVCIWVFFRPIFSCCYYGRKYRSICLLDVPPTQVVFGKNSEKRAGKHIKKYGESKVLLHYGGHQMTSFIRYIVFHLYSNFFSSNRFGLWGEP